MGGALNIGSQSIRPDRHTAERPTGLKSCLSGCHRSEFRCRCRADTMQCQFDLHLIDHHRRIQRTERRINAGDRSLDHLHTAHVQSGAARHPTGTGAESHNDLEGVSDPTLASDRGGGLLHNRGLDGYRIAAVCRAVLSSCRPAECRSPASRLRLTDCG
jgi:hypothetical protein